ncbi:glycoside hydrolase family 10 protein [Spirillospora sp. CA-253888]
MAWRSRTGTGVRLASAALTAGALTACVPALGGTDDKDGDDGRGRAAPAPVAAQAECKGVPAPGDSKARQLRGMWIATVANIDWPKDGDKTAAQQQARFRRLLDTAKSLNLNAVFVQIRPNSDAFYPSPHEPWSQWITGTPGKDPGYDVLDFMVKEAHARNLEFHAWFNPYRVARHDDLDKLAPTSPARKHPDWVRKYGGGMWYDPGLPQVRDLATKAVMDVVGKYDIDAVHFDDYFYPYPEGTGDYPDQATFKTYGKGMKLADWRRRNVDELVSSLSRRIHAAKPWVRFGISPFGVWRNKTTDPAGSATSALQSYDAQYADTRKWIREGWIDYVTPQLYWPIGDRRADYATLVDWWSRQVAGTKVQLTIGQAAYRVGEDATWKKPAELSRHLTLNARHPQVRGDVYFSAANMAADKQGFASRLRADHYARPAIAPAAPTGGGKAPAATQGVAADNDDKGVRVRWRPSQGAAYYAVYRTEGKGPSCGPVDPARLVATVRGGGIVDPTAKPGRTYTYQVTALDRLHHESAPGRAATVTADRG